MSPGAYWWDAPPPDRGEGLAIRAGRSATPRAPESGLVDSGGPLTSIDLDGVLGRRSALTRKLQALQQSQEPRNASRGLVDLKLAQLADLEAVVTSTLSLFDELLVAESHAEPGDLVSSHSNLKSTTETLIQGFQSNIVKAKTNLATLVKQDKKETDKLAKAAKDDPRPPPLPPFPADLEGPGGPGDGTRSDAPPVTDPPDKGVPAGTKGVMAGVMDGVTHAADEMETTMNENDAFVEGQKKKGATLDTVVKLEGSDKEEAKEAAEKEAAKKEAAKTEAADRHDVDPAPNPDSASPQNTGPTSPSHTNNLFSTIMRQLYKSSGHLPVIIDSEGNQYTLSRAADMTTHQEDSRFLDDIFHLLIACFGCSLVFYALGMPTFFGHIVAGILLGPNGFNVLHSIIQLETLSNGLGVTFIMLFLGLEFNAEKLVKVWKVAFFGSFLCLLIMTGIFVGASSILNGSINEATVLGASVWLSSTTVLLKCLKPGDVETVSGRGILGILIIQDVFLGAFLALLPALKSSGMEAVQILAKIGGSLAVFGLLCWVLKIGLGVVFGHYQRKRILSPRLQGPASSPLNPELALLSGFVLALVLAQLTTLGGLSMEIGCFAAGLLLSWKKSIADRLIPLVEPLRDVFACLFFASIGFHIFPVFFYKQSGLLLLLTVSTVVFKFVVVFGVMRFVFAYDAKPAFTMAVGLAQISEFTFIFASKAKRYGVLSREFYYLLLATTALTLACTPFLWRFVSNMTSGASAERETLLPFSHTAVADVATLAPAAGGGDLEEGDDKQD